MKIHEEVYEGHLIRANDTAAMVFIDGSKNLETKFRAISLEDALTQSKAWIDEKTQERKADRRQAHIGTVEGYTEILGITKMSKARRLMLVAHRRAEDRKMTPAQLAEAAGWKTQASANTHYAKLGKEVAEHLGLEIDGTDKEAWTSALARLDEETGELQMHEEVAEAMDRLNIG